jgi:hypothetical protein
MRKARPLQPDLFAVLHALPEVSHPAQSPGAQPDPFWDDREASLGPDD